MPAALDNQPTLEQLPEEQRALLLALEGRDGPTRARDLADAAHINRRTAAIRLEALARLGVVLYQDGSGPTHADDVRVYELTADGRQLLAARSASAGPAPTVYDTVVVDRTRHSEHRVAVEVSRALDRADKHLVTWITAELERVYQAGVTDGFAQGVAAEVTARTQEATRAA